MVPSTFSRLKAARCLPVVLAALIFAGCGTHTPDQSTAYMQGTAQADSAFIFSRCSKALMIPDQLAITRHSCTGERR